MNKFFLRLTVAWTCFVLSVGVSSLWKLVRGENSSVPLVALAPAESKELTQDEVHLRQIYSEYGPAQTRHDRAFFERIESEDFRLFYNELSLSREEDIQWMERMPPGIVFNNHPEDISIFGNAAVVHGRMEIRYNDGSVYPWGYIDVWVKRGDRWQIRSTTSHH